MIHQQFTKIKIYLDDKNFLQKGLISLIGPFYSQYIYYCLKMAIINNPHLFTYNVKEATHICMNSNNTGCVLDQAKRYSVINFNNFNVPDTLDKENVSIINLSRKNFILKYAKNLNLFPPFDYEMYLNSDYELPSSPRYNSFNFSIFCNSILDIEELLKFWNNHKIINGNLYCFYVVSSPEDFEIINRFSKVRSNNKMITFNHIDYSSFGSILNILKKCVFSLHYTSDLVYPFWAARFKCFPVVLENDVFSSYVKYIENSDKFIPIIESFWKYPKELAGLIKNLEKIKISKFNLADIIIKD